MPKLSLSEQLDRAIQAILKPDAAQGSSDGAAIDPKIASLAAIAQQLRDLPQNEFRASLKSKLQGSQSMASKPAATPEQPKEKVSQPSAQSQQKETKPRAGHMPEGYRTITPYLTVANAPQLIDFLKQAFDADEVFRNTTTTGRIHCELRVGNSMLMVGGSDGTTPWSGETHPTALHVYVADCATSYQRALKAGATSLMEPAEQQYGEHLAAVKDASGNEWYIAFPTYLGADYSPDRVQTVQAYLHPVESVPVIDFLKNAFDAEELGRAASPEGRVWHTTIKIGDATLEMSDAHERYQPMPTMFYLYVEDTDTLYMRALKAGGSSISEPTDQFYGDRVGAIKDPFGNQWYIATHLGESKPEAAQTAESAKLTAPVKHIREGFHTVTPYLLASNGARLIDFLKQAFGAEEHFRIPQSGAGKIIHAELRIGDSMLELSDGTSEFPPRPAMHNLYVDDVHATYQRALDSGGTSIFEPAERPYGDLEAGVRDTDGNHWYITARRTSEHVIPDTPTIVPGFSTPDAAKFVEFMRLAFAAEEAFMHKSPSGTVIHGRIRIGDSIVAIGELRGKLPPMPFHLHMYVPDTDAVYESALRAGAKSLRAPKDEPYGDRAATVEDAFGNYWSIATHIKDVKF